MTSQESIERAAEVLKVPGKVVCTGLGKSGHVSRKIAATLSSVGSPALFLHPTEAAHGDLGLIQKGDAILVLSRSGRVFELEPLMNYAHENGIPIVLISENVKSKLAIYAQYIVKLPIVAEAWGHAPTTSTTMQMALGDAIAIELAINRGFTNEDFLAVHPGGAIGEMKDGNNPNS
jgi:arabinose-5-phosphate isomerase